MLMVSDVAPFHLLDIVRLYAIMGNVEHLIS